MVSTMSEAYTVTEVICVEGSEEDILQRAASVNYLADFSVPACLVAAAKAKGLKPLPAEKFELLPGKGARARIGGMEVRVGSPKLLVEEKILVPVSFVERIKELTREGKMVMVVLSGRSLSGAVILSGESRAEASFPTASPAVSSKAPLLQKLLRFFFPKS